MATVIMAAIVVIFVFGSPDSAISAEAQKCTPDPERTLQDFVAEAQKIPGHYLGSKSVPKNLVIDPAPVRIAVVNPTFGYMLPIENSQSSFLLGANARDLAICRVKDNNSRWWFVLIDQDGTLIYLNGKDVWDEEHYEKESEKENRDFEEKLRRDRHPKQPIN